METLQKKEQFSKVFADQQSFTMRRAYVATMYAMMKEERSAKTSYPLLERYRQELAAIDEEGSVRYAALRQLQNRYRVEYETEERDDTTARLKDKVSCEELYLFNDCEIDTYANGWDMEDAATQDLLYEVAGFLLQFKSSRYLITNIKRL